MDAPTANSLSSSSPRILVTPGAVLPHNDTDSNHLAHQTSHLDLATSTGGSNRLAHDASSANVSHEPGSAASRRRRRACSACCRVSDVTTPVQHARQSTSLVEPLFSSPNIPRLGSNVRTSESHERTREEMGENRAGFPGYEKEECHPIQHFAFATNPSTALVPTHSQQTSWAGRSEAQVNLTDFPNEVLVHILSYLDVCDLLATSRTSHHFRSLALSPTIHRLRLQHARAILPPLLTNPLRPSLADLIARHIFLTHTTVVSRKLARSLTAIRLSRRLAVRPPPEALVARSVLPPECVPGHARVAPALVAKTRAVERERVKDGLRRWVGSVWERQWREKAEARQRWEERSGVGRVWRLRRFWERVGRGEIEAH